LVSLRERLFKAITDFVPGAAMFAPHHRTQILVSDVGIVLWIAALAAALYTYGFATVFRVYGVPYLW
jgi:omega-6 fatty acid desaturase (delta-12 desaturase)